MSANVRTHTIALIFNRLNAAASAIMKGECRTRLNLSGADWCDLTRVRMTDRPLQLLSTPHMQLVQLRQEHRELDVAIARLSETRLEDELMLRRLKKRKLMLKDRIAALERSLTPDELA